MNSSVTSRPARRRRRPAIVDGRVVDADAGRLADHVVERHQRETEREAARHHQHEAAGQRAVGFRGGRRSSALSQALRLHHARGDERDVDADRDAAPAGCRRGGSRRRCSAVGSPCVMRATAHALLDDRGLVERVVRRRRRHRPLEAVVVRAVPDLVGRLRAALRALEDDVHEQQLRQAEAEARRSTRPCSSRRTASSSPGCGAACRPGPGSAAGRTAR